jgi:Putative prokaryotic signal transducing protein
MKKTENTELVVVGEFGDKLEAELARGALQAAGIDSMVGADDAGGTEPGLWMGGVKLLVRAEDAKRAAEVLGPVK